MSLKLQMQSKFGPVIMSGSGQLTRASVQALVFGYRTPFRVSSSQYLAGPNISPTAGGLKWNQILAATDFPISS